MFLSLNLRNFLWRYDSFIIVNFKKHAFFSKLAELYLCSLISCRDNTTRLRNPKTLSLCYCFLHFSFKSRYHGEIAMCKLIPVWILALRVWVKDSVYISSRSRGGTVVPLSLSNFFDSDNIGLRQPLSLLKKFDRDNCCINRILEQIF